MVAKLVEKRNALEAKRKQLAEIFEQAGVDLDMDKVTVHELEGKTSAEKAKAIKLRNDELTALGEEVDNLVSLEKASSETKGFTEFGLPTGDEEGKGGKSSGKSMVKSMADLFIESKTFKEFSGKRGPETVVEMDNALMDMFFGKDGGRGYEAKALFDSTSFAPEATRIDRIVDIAMRRPVVGDLIPEGRTGQNAIPYMEETTATNGAAAVAEGGTKPESALAFTEKSSPVRKLATVLPVTDEIFEDVPAMRSYVENRLRFFLQLTEEAQLLNGNGTAPNLRGILQTSGIQTQAKGTDPVPDAVYKAMTLINVNAFLDADGAVFHPNDWQDIRLLRTADGIYIWGSPSEAGPERIWGLGIVKTPVMTENTALIGAFQPASQKFRRSDVTFAVSDQHNDFFITNKLMLRVEERLALVIFRPAGFCTVTGI